MFSLANLKAMRATHLAPGTSWNMTDEAKKEVPLRWKLAATHLAGQFHRVVCTRWQSDEVDLSTGEVTRGQLEIAVYRDRDTVDPTWYHIIRSKDSGDMYRQEVGTGLRRWWPIYKDGKKDPDDAPKPPPVSTRRKVRQIHYVDPVREDVFDDNVHVLFCERAELNDDLRSLDLKFARDPQPEHVVKMAELRKQLSEVEQKIVVVAMMQRAKR